MEPARGEDGCIMSCSKRSRQPGTDRSSRQQHQLMSTTHPFSTHRQASNCQWLCSSLAQISITKLWTEKSASGLGGIPFRNSLGFGCPLPLTSL